MKIRYIKSLICNKKNCVYFYFIVLILTNFLQIFEILRLAIIHNSLEKQKRQNSAWLRQLLPTPSDIIGVIQQVIGSRSI